MVTQLDPDALVLETERLRLRPFSPDDEDLALRLLTDPAVMRFVGGVQTPDGVARRMADVTKRGAGGRIGIWCVSRKDTGEKIGDGVLLPVPIDADDTEWALVDPTAYPAVPVEVGYLLTPGAWGRGFATEICARLLRFAFERTSLDVVVAVTDPENFPSQNVLRKSGMRQTGLRRAYGEDGLPWFEMTRAEWRRH